MYADYRFYKDTYHGAGSETEYTRLAVRAAAYVDRITFGRAQTAKESDLDAVKMAECAIVDELVQTLQKNSRMNLHSGSALSMRLLSATVLPLFPRRCSPSVLVWAMKSSVPQRHTGEAFLRL